MMSIAVFVHGRECYRALRSSADINGKRYARGGGYCMSAVAERLQGALIGGGVGAAGGSAIGAATTPSPRYGYYSSGGGYYR